jgi:hypothetical protein
MTPEKSQSKLDKLTNDLKNLNNLKGCSEIPRNTLLLMQAIEKISSENQPRFLRASCLSFLSMISFATHKSPIYPHMPSPLSNYTVLVGNSGVGKGFFSTWPRQLILDNNPEIGKIFIQEPQSTHALLRILNECNAGIICKSEVGNLFLARETEAIKNDLISSLCSVWSGEFLAGKESKKKEDSLPPVHYPLTCLLGACTKQQFIAMLNNQNFSLGGLFSRTDFVLSDEVSNKDIEISEGFQIDERINAMVARKLERLKNKLDSSKTLAGDIFLVPENDIKITQEAKEYLRKLKEKYKNYVLKNEQEQNFTLSSIYARFFEKICRMSCAIALWESDDNKPCVNLEIVKFAQFHYQDLIGMVFSLSSAANYETQNGKLAANILEAIKKLTNGERNKKVTLSDIRKTNMGLLREAKPQDIRAAIETLEQTEQIGVFLNKETRKPSLQLYLL